MSSSGRKDSGDVEYLKRLLREYEEKIIALENEVAKVIVEKSVTGVDKEFASWVISTNVLDRKRNVKSM